MRRKRKILNLLSLIINLSIFYFTVGSLINIFTVASGDALSPAGFECFKYFTVLSNVFLALTCVLSFIYNIKNDIDDTYKFPKFSNALKFSSTISVTVTLFTVVLFLAPLVAIGGKSYFLLFTGNNFWLHFVNPVLAIVDYILLEQDKSLEFKYTLLGMIPVILYSILYTFNVVVIGAENGGWSDFYGFTFGGKLWLMPIVFIVMYSATFGFSVLVWQLKKKVKNN